ncbi:SDR family NAD(P)-dependent oxidoreductase [Pelagibacterium mangrovi]|uniref:SDR family NAD(P)-dependent oxidoreductase n=1 Tax=Pelagibacterium mangrovi TaxID=3119828 RepID=UPI002FCC3C82
MLNLKNRICLVTGAGGDIGGAIAARLAEFGAKVQASDLDPGRVTARFSGSLSALKLDVTSQTDWDQAVSSIIARYGKLDVVVNCAGLFSTTADRIDQMELDQWRRLHAVNLDGAFLGTRAAVRTMAKSGGAVINIGSIVGYFGARSGVGYGTSKAAICGLTMQAAANCVSMGIPVRINAIHPGYVLTDAALASELARHGTREKAIAAFATRNPGGVIITPENVADSVVFLASDMAKMINGVQLLVDAGLSTQMPGRPFEAPQNAQ